LLIGALFEFQVRGCLRVKWISCWQGKRTQMVVSTMRVRYSYSRLPSTDKMNDLKFLIEINLMFLLPAFIKHVMAG